MPPPPRSRAGTSGKAAPLGRDTPSEGRVRRVSVVDPNLQLIFSTTVQTRRVMDTGLLRGLIWEDDHDARRAVSAVMEQCGFQVVAVAMSVPDALRAAHRTQPHAVVLDLALSGELGLNIVLQLAAVTPGVAVVMLSPFVALEAAASEAGAWGLVDKSDLRQLTVCLRGIARQCLAGGAATA